MIWCLFPDAGSRDTPFVDNEATCAAQITHFSVYAIVAPTDTDDDGIFDLFGGIEEIRPGGPNVIDLSSPQTTRGKQRARSVLTRGVGKCVRQNAHLGREF